MNAHFAAPSARTFMTESSVSALKNESLALMQQQAFQQALDLLQRACAQAPDDPEAWYLLAGAQGRLGDFAAAEQSCRRALARSPDYVEAHYRLGNALDAQGRHEQALNAFQRALDLNPEFLQAWNNRGVALMALTRPDEAEQCYRRALALNAQAVDARINLGLALLGQCRVYEAIEALDEALALAPDHPEANWTLALARLLVGDFEGGWPLYDWRWRRGPKQLREFPQPLWDGRSSLAGKTLLLHHEQGYGDTLQFIRYLPQLKAMGATTLVLCQPALERVLTTAEGVDHLIVDPASLPPFDMHLPLASLPGRLGTTLETIPARVPYLAVPSGDYEYVQTAIRGAGAAYNVGIVWAGNPTHANDHNRSCDPGWFATLSEVPGVQLFSLQKSGDGGGEAVVPGSIDLAPLLGDFADTAAAVTELDLVISVDTSVVHLAGALGAPVWILLPFAPDWRWMLERSDSPWYPTARVFRQREWGQWRSVFEDVTGALAAAARQPV